MWKDTLLLATALAGAATPAAAADRSVRAAAGTVVPRSQEVVRPQEAAAEADILQRSANLDLGELHSLTEALESLSRATGLPLLFSPTLVPDRDVRCPCRHASVGQALAIILRGTDLGFVVNGGQIVIAPQIDSPRTAVSPSASEGFSPNLELDQRPIRLAGELRPARAHGRLRGRVSDEQSGEPLSAAQVYVEDVMVGTLSNESGRFRIRRIPAGTRRIRAELIGYRPVFRDIRVDAGKDVVVNLALTREALRLDEVIVTGTAGGVRRRALGNVVGRVEASRITERGAVSNFQDLLMGREVGVTFQGAQGIIGAGAAIRVRGVSSFSLSQQPLIYVDGIRIDNDAEAGPPIRGGPLTSKLNDLNPEDIESLEIIKGPAAATLYGTEASAGVIQIITKRGRTGSPQFTATVRQGANWLADAEWKVGDACMLLPSGNRPPTSVSGYMYSDRVFCHNLLVDEAAAGRPVFTTGHLQNYSVDMRGGTDAVRYYASGSWGRDVGMVSYDYDQHLRLRANLSVLPSSNLTIDFNTGYVDGITSYMQQVSNSGLWENVSWGNPATLGTRNRGFLRATPEAIAETSATRDYTGFTGSATFTHQPIPWFTHRLIVGTDVGNDLNVTLVPRHPEGESWYFGAMSLGRKEVRRPVRTVATLDYSGSAAFQATDAISLRSSVGFQYYRSSFDDLQAVGTVFPAPGITSLSGAATETTSEIHSENASLGLYVQEEVSINDRAFLAAGVRGDDNSAFGADYQAAIYPKLSAAWVISEEDFWPLRDVVNSMRLRAAWGKAGRQPSTFAAVTTYVPQVGPGASPAVRPGILGNPEVGPEISSELEFGVDMALFGDRVTAEVTHFQQDVRGALIEVPVASSTGFAGAQAMNLGHIENWGWETGLDVRLISRERFGLDVAAHFSHNDNVVRDLGGPEGILLTGANNPSYARVGFPFPAAFWIEPVSATFSEDGLVSPQDLMCDAGREVSEDGFGLLGGDHLVPCSEAPLLFHGRAAVPKNEATVSATLRLLNALWISALVEWRGYSNVISSQAGCQFSCYPRQVLSVDPWGEDAPLVQALAVGGGLARGGRNAMLEHSGAFAKLREVSLVYTLPQSFARRLGASRATISVAGRNLWTIYQAARYTPNNDPRGAPISDVENRQVDPFSPNMGNPAVPPLSSFVMALRMVF